MTHEFKTPLTNIGLAAKMLSKDQNIRQEEKIRHYSGIILDENEKLRLQVEQVLNMTAFERNEIPLQKVELDAHRLISDAVRTMGIQLESRQGYINTNLNAESFIVNADKTHLTNSLLNLIDNAIKYSPEKPEINIETLNAHEDLIIKISDQGIGIDEKYRDKVFDKFFRVPTGDVHNVKGFGLGLAYTKKIIELHGGSIELRSEKEKGTTFIITLPHA
jgi:signal transduction histidine kinase